MRRNGKFMSSLNKILLTTFLVSAVVATALWLIGGTKIQHSRAVSIAAPPATVFSSLTEPDQLMQWMDGLTEFNPPSEPLNEIGMTADVVFRDGNRQFRYNLLVLRYEPSTYLAIQSQNQVAVTTTIYKLEEIAGGTKLSVEVKKSWKGLGRFLAAFSSDNIENRLSGDLRRLKKLIESGAAE